MYPRAVGPRVIDGHQATAHQRVGSSISNSFVPQVRILGVPRQNQRANQRSGDEEYTEFVRTPGTII